MIGLFQELGPCGVDINGQPFNNPYSWSNVSNMVSRRLDVFMSAQTDQDKALYRPTDHGWYVIFDSNSRI